MELKDGGELLYALEAAHNDGPWDNPEKFHRLNGVLRYSFGAANARSAITAMAYSAAWNATDQIPQRAVDKGLVGRYGAIDPTDGGDTARYSLSYETEHRTEDGGLFKFNAYAIRSRLDLYSDFTYNLDHDSPLNADQFEQAEQRRVFGFSTSRGFDTSFGGGRGSSNGAEAIASTTTVGRWSSTGWRRSTRTGATTSTPTTAPAAGR